MERQHRKRISRNEEKLGLFKRNFSFDSPLFLFPIALFFYVFSLYINQINYDFSWSIRSIGLIVNAALVMGMLHSHKKKKTSLSEWISVILIGGFFLRLSYAFTTDIFLRQHDVGQITLDATGHYGYILTILRTFQLPITNTYQFYHPPFYHVLAAGWLFLAEALFSFENIDSLFQTLSILSLLISYGTLYLVHIISKQLSLHVYQRFLIVLISSYHPIFILMSARHNNDPLSYFFLALIVLIFLKWMQNKKTGTLVFLALSIGFGMLTKISVALVTPIIAVVFLLEWLKHPQTRSYLFKQYVIFGLVVLPIGLSYIVRNYLLFDQAPTYVWQITNDALSTSTYSLWQRFSPVYLGSFFDRLYPYAAADYNIWVYLMKTSVFGEFSYWGGQLYSVFLLTLNVGLFYISSLLVTSIPLYFKRLPTHILPALSYGLLLFLSYLFFNFRYPFGPTMDFRYLVPLVWISIYVITVHPLALMSRAFFSRFLILFSIASVLFFTFAF